MAWVFGDFCEGSLVLDCWHKFSSATAGVHCANAVIYCSRGILITVMFCSRGAITGILC